MIAGPEITKDGNAGTSNLVLVTGGTGFIATHCIIQLLKAGYKVKTTIRSKSREADVYDMLRTGGMEPASSLSFAVTDLMKDDGWQQAIEGCDFVLHVASPFPAGIPASEDELIIPARDGALRVLRASRDAGVKRVVLTSSFAAIGYGHEQTERPFTEEDWTDPGKKNITAYVKSKTIAEQAAWDFIKKEGGSLELSVVNPVGVFGPVLGPDYSTSVQLVKRLMDGSLKGCPRMTFGIVDVRDVADLHLKAMTIEAAKGERFLAIGGNFMSMLEMAKVLKEKMGEAAKRVPTKVLPNWMVKLASLFDPAIKQIVPELGKIKSASNAKAKNVLGWSPRSNEEAIVATAKSLVRLGLVGDH